MGFYGGFMRLLMSADCSIFIPKDNRDSPANSAYLGFSITFRVDKKHFKLAGLQKNTGTDFPILKAFFSTPRNDIHFRVINLRFMVGISSRRCYGRIIRTVTSLNIKDCNQ